MNDTTSIPAFALPFQTVTDADGLATELRTDHGSILVGAPPPALDSITVHVLDLGHLLARQILRASADPVAFLVLLFEGSARRARMFVDSRSLYAYDLDKPETADQVAELGSLVAQEIPFFDMPAWIADEYVDEDGLLVMDPGSWVWL